MKTKIQTILAVDDNPDDLFLLEHALAKILNEHRLITAVDGVAAEMMLQNVNQDEEVTLPSLIFLDVHMPRCSGLQFLAWLKDKPCLNRIPVVLLSGSENPADADKALKLGALTCLRKPAKLGEIRDFVNRVPGLASSDQPVQSVNR